jgi:H+/Cl- antiporter ClcA
MRSDPVTKRFSGAFTPKLVGKGALVGLAAGVLITLYRQLLSKAELLLRCVRIPLVNGGVLGFLAILAGVVCLSAAIGAVMDRWESVVGSGIPQVEAEIMGHMDMPWATTIFAKVAAGVACALAGFSLGREGPSVQLGALCGKAYSRLKHGDKSEEHVLVTCGAGAGMAAAFQAPLTGVMFAIEEIHKGFTAPLVISCMSSCVVAVVVATGVLGAKPVLELEYLADMPHSTYWLLILLGILLGALGALHNLGMFACHGWLSNIRRFEPYSRLLAPALLSVCAIYFVPTVLDGGDAILKMLQYPEALSLGALVFVLLAKYLATAVASGSGAPGGTLFPLVCMGALAGAVFGNLAILYAGLPAKYLVNFMLLGVAGLFASVVRTPVTGCVLVFELTGSFTELLPIAIVSLLSYVVASMLPVQGFYEHQLAGLLERDVPETPLEDEGITIRTVFVSQGSAADGKKICEIDWPTDLRIVSVTRAGVRHVAMPDLVVEGCDYLIVVMDASEEARTLEVLKSLVETT